MQSEVARAKKGHMCLVPNNKGFGSVIVPFFFKPQSRHVIEEQRVVFCMNLRTSLTILLSKFWNSYMPQLKSIMSPTKYATKKLNTIWEQIESNIYVSTPGLVVNCHRSWTQALTQRQERIWPVESKTRTEHTSFCTNKANKCQIPTLVMTSLSRIRLRLLIRERIYPLGCHKLLERQPILLLDERRYAKSETIRVVEGIRLHSLVVCANWSKCCSGQPSSNSSR